MAENEFTPLGASGLMVSRIALGCNNLGRAQTVTEQFEGSQRLIDAALNAGITLFDVADIYGATPGTSEEFLGRALGTRRDEVVIATKFGMDMRGVNGQDWGARGSRRYLRRAVEASLSRLGTDWIDLYQYHQYDGITPIEETMAAMNELVQEGKVRYLGHSNLPGWQIAQADAIARREGWAPFISAQNEYSLLKRGVEREVLPSVRAHGLGLIPFFPLADGLLTGKYRRDQLPEDGRLTRQKPQLLEKVDWDQLEAFAAFAQERGIAELDAAIGWLLAQPGVDTVIAGATKPEQIEQNASVSWRPDEAELAELDAIFPLAK